MAQQFNPSSLPWPDGVSVDPGTATGYVFQDSQGARCPIRSGDYVAVAGGSFQVVLQADFEAEYQV